MIPGTNKSQMFQKTRRTCHSCAKSFTSRQHTIRAKVFSMQRLSTRNADWRCTCARRTYESGRIWQLNDDALIRVIVISDVHARSKLARRLIPLLASLRVCLLVLVASFFSSIPAQASNVSSPTTGRRLDLPLPILTGMVARIWRLLNRGRIVLLKQFTGFKFSSATVGCDL